MVLIKRETSINLNLTQGGDLGEFHYNDSAIENLNQSEGLRNLVFQIFREVGPSREPNMKNAIKKFSQIIYLTQNDLTEDEREDFLAKDYAKALKKFMSDVEDTQLKALLQIASQYKYLDDTDDMYDELSTLNLTVGQLDNEGAMRQELDLPLGEMREDTQGSLLQTSLARAFLNNENLAPTRDYKEIVKYIDIRPEGNYIILEFRAKDYVHKLLKTNGYLAEESTTENPVVKEGLTIPIVNNRGERARKVTVDEEETEEERRTREESELGSEIESDLAIESEGEGIEETGEDDSLENLGDEEFSQALDERMKKKSYILKAKKKTLTPTGSEQHILSHISLAPEYYRDKMGFMGNRYILHKPDGTTTKFKTASKVADAAEKIDLTKIVIEKILKGKKQDTPIHDLVENSLRPLEGELTVKNYTMKLKVVNKADVIIDQLLEITQRSSSGEYPEERTKEIKKEIKSQLKKFLKVQVELHELLKTTELKNIFFGADSTQDFLDAMIEYRHSKREEDVENELPLEDYNAIMKIVGGMKMKAGTTFDPEQTRPKGYGTRRVGEMPKGKDVEYATFPTSGKGDYPKTTGIASSSENSPFGNKGQDKTKSITVGVGDDEEKIALIIPRMRGITPSVEAFVDAIFTANFMKKRNKIRMKRRTTRLGDNDKKFHTPSADIVDETVEFSDEDWTQGDNLDSRTMVKLITLSEDIKEIDTGKVLFVNFRPYKKTRRTTERDRTPNRPRYTEKALTILQKIKSYFDKAKQQMR